MTRPPLLCAFGSCQRREFQPILHELAQMAPLPLLQTWNATEKIRFSCAALLFCQSRPGQFSQDFFHSLIRQNPLTPRILLLGALCEGENRTGFPLYGGSQVYVHQWNPFHVRQFELLLQGRPSLFALPPTAKNEEIALFAARQENALTAGTNALIFEQEGPFGNDPHFGQLLADFLAQNGVTVLRSRRRSGRARPQAFAGTVLLDADDSPFPVILKAAQSLRHEFADAKIEVFINSPRIDEKIALTNLGVDRVWAKPLF